MKKYGEENFEVVVLEKYPCESKFHLVLQEDYYIHKYNAIDKGYNTKFNFVISDLLCSKLNENVINLINIKIHLLFHRHLAHNNFDDSLCQKGIVYKITNIKTNKSFVHYTSSDLKKEIYYLYSNVISDIVDVEFKKLFDDFKKYNYDDYTYSILKHYKFYGEKNDKTDVNHFIIEFDSINNGLNTQPYKK